MGDLIFLGLLQKSGVYILHAPQEAYQDQHSHYPAVFIGL